MNIYYSGLKNPEASSAATIPRHLSNDRAKRVQLVMKGGLALVVILLALMSMPSLTHAAVPSAKIESGSGSSEPSLRSKAENNARYKRLRAKAHRNAARAKAHARAVRAEEAAR